MAGVPDDQSTERIALALDRIERQIRKSRTTCELPVCPEVDRVRAQQRTFLKGHQKFPDFVDVGIEVWERVHDWHVRTLQPVAVTQRPRDSYAMARGGPRNSDSLLRWDPDPGEGVWHATEETELSG